MFHHVVIGIDPTYRTLFSSELSAAFRARSTEYIIVALDDHLNQVGVPDYGYTNKKQAQRLASRLNSLEKME